MYYIYIHVNILLFSSDILQSQDYEHVHNIQHNQSYNDNQTSYNAEQSAYYDFHKHGSARAHFHKNFNDNPFGYVCSICNRLWFKKDLKLLTNAQDVILVSDNNEYTLQQIIEVNFNMQKIKLFFTIIK